MGRRGGTLVGDLVSMGTTRTEGKSGNAQSKCDEIGVSGKEYVRHFGTYSQDRLRCNRGDQ